MTIGVLYFHLQRHNDIRTWMRATAKAKPLSILLIVSVETQELARQLIGDCGHEVKVVLWSSVVDEPCYAPIAKTKFAAVIYDFYWAGKVLDAQVRAATIIFSSFRVGVLITYDHRPPALLAFMKAAYRKSIPVFLPAIVSLEPDLYGYTANNMRPIRIMERILVWVLKCIKSRRYSRGRLLYTPEMFLALLVRRMLPPDPWAAGSSKLISAVGVDCERTFQALVARDVTLEKLFITGITAFDAIDFQSCARTTKRSLLVCALPQYAEHGAMSFGEAINCVRNLLDALRCYCGEVIISLHPRMNRDKYSDLIESYGYTCVTSDLEKLLPKCAVFIAASSTTVTWAILAGARVVILDHIPPTSPAFRRYASVDFVEKDIKLELPKLLSNLPLNWAENSALDRKMLSFDLVTDGAVGERNIRILFELTKKTVD